MTTVYAIKVSNGDDSLHKRAKQRLVPLEDFHCAADTSLNAPAEAIGVDVMKGTWFLYRADVDLRLVVMIVVRYWLPRVTSLLSFIWYALASAPGFYWLDSAELSAGGLGLGSAHPSGFPLHMMLIKAASLFPLGELAFRVNLLSALCAALAVGGVARLILLLGKEDWATAMGAVAGSGALCFTLLFARQATVAEVYAPTALLIILTLSFFERVAEGGHASVGLSLAWVAGLGFAVHPEFRLLMGLPIAALVVQRAYRGARWPLLTPAFAGFSALAAYLYLPVRSATGRVGSLDWGHPRTLGSAWDHATGAGIRKVFDDRMMSTVWEVVSCDVQTFGRQILDHMGVMAVLAGFAGLVIILVERRTRWVGVSLATMISLDFLYSSWVNPMGLVDWQNGVPLVLALSVCAGVGVASLARSAGLAAPFVGSVAALVVVIQPALLSLSAVANVGELPREVAEHALWRAPSHAIVLTQGDSLAAATSYLQSVEGARPDVAALVVQMLVDTERVEYVMSRTALKHSEIKVDVSRGVAGLWASGRPMLWESGLVSPPVGLGVVQGAVVGRLVPSSQAAPPDPLVLSQIARLYEGRGAKDRAARRELASALSYLASGALAFRNVPMATHLFEAALEVRPSHAVALVNLGVIYSRSNDLNRAVEVTERALEFEPNRPRALVNAARYRLALGHLKRARGHAARALVVAPLLASSWTLAGIIDMKAGRLTLARERLQHALLIAPGNREAAGALQALGSGR